MYPSTVFAATLLLLGALVSTGIAMWRHKSSAAFIAGGASLLSAPLVLSEVSVREDNTASFTGGTVDLLDLPTAVYDIPIALGVVSVVIGLIIIAVKANPRRKNRARTKSAAEEESVSLDDLRR